MNRPIRRAKQEHAGWGAGGIPRAVMYDAQRHQHNPTYALNRQLIHADTHIIVIDAATMAATVTQTATAPGAASATRDTWVQRGMFGE